MQGWQPVPAMHCIVHWMLKFWMFWQVPRPSQMLPAKLWPPLHWNPFPIPRLHAVYAGG
jgi:hypothetical protein